MKRTVVRYVYTMAIVAGVYAIGVVTGFGLSWMTKTAPTETTQAKKISPMTLIEFYDSDLPRCGMVHTMIRLKQLGNGALSNNCVHVTVTDDPETLHSTILSIPRSHPDVPRLYELLKDGRYHWVTLQLFEDAADQLLTLEKVNWPATEK